MGAGGWVLMAIIMVVLLGLLVAFIVWLVGTSGAAHTATTTRSAGPRARSSIAASPRARSASRNTSASRPASQHRQALHPRPPSRQPRHRSRHDGWLERRDPQRGEDHLPTMRHVGEGDDARERVPTPLPLHRQWRPADAQGGVFPTVSATGGLPGLGLPVACPVLRRGSIRLRRGRCFVWCVG